MNPKIKHLYLAIIKIGFDKLDLKNIPKYVDKKVYLVKVNDAIVYTIDSVRIKNFCDEFGIKLI